MGWGRLRGVPANPHVGHPGLRLDRPAARPYSLRRMGSSKGRPRAGAATRNLAVGPLRPDFVLWRCLHAGPLNRGNIDEPGPHPEVDWPYVRSRNAPLLQKLAETYGSCAIAAWDGDDVVATLRFYPKALCSFSASGGAAFCLQQRSPAGPPDNLILREFPPLQKLTDRTLFIHCLFVAAPTGEPGRFRRKGLATRMVRELIGWATRAGWSAIEATAYEELPLLYAISGVAGRRFWRRLGFKVVHEDTEPGISGDLEDRLRQEAPSAGLSPDDVTKRYRMRLELTGNRPSLGSDGDGESP